MQNDTKSILTSKEKDANYWLKGKLMQTHNYRSKVDNEKVCIPVLEKFYEICRQTYFRLCSPWDRGLRAALLAGLVEDKFSNMTKVQQ
jgi:hypothetical protein